MRQIATKNEMLSPLEVSLMPCSFMAIAYVFKALKKTEISCAEMANMRGSVL